MLCRMFSWQAGWLRDGPIAASPPWQDLCYDNEDACSSSKAAIAAVDKLDFVFVDGDSRLLPWHPRTRKVRALVARLLQNEDIG